MFAGCLAEKCQVGVCPEPRGEQMPVQPQPGHMEVAEVCRRFVFDETFVHPD